MTDYYVYVDGKLKTTIGVKTDPAGSERAVALRTAHILYPFQKVYIAEVNNGY